LRGRERHFEIEHLRRRLQALGMFGALEDGAAIASLALEHATRVMQAVAPDVQIGVAPRHELPVVPDDPGAIVEGSAGHFIRLKTRQAVNCRSRFPSREPGFASPGKSRYVSCMRARRGARRNDRTGEAGWKNRSFRQTFALDNKPR